MKCPSSLGRFSKSSSVLRASRLLLNLPRLSGTFNHSYHLEDAAYYCYLHCSTIFKMSCFKPGLLLNKYLPVQLFIVFRTNKGSLEKPPQSPKTCEFLVLGVFFKYDLSSILVRVNEVHRPFWQFLVRLCGIVGGIFATSGEMNVTLLVTIYRCL